MRRNLVRVNIGHLINGCRRPTTNSPVIEPVCTDAVHTAPPRYACCSLHDVHYGTEFAICMKLACLICVIIITCVLLSPDAAKLVPSGIERHDRRAECMRSSGAGATGMAVTRACRGSHLPVPFYSRSEAIAEPTTFISSFLPCDCEAYARSCCRPLSVRLSVCRVHCDTTKAPSEKSSIMTNRKSPYELSNEPKMNIVRCP